MKARTNLLARLALATAVSVGLAACGGSSNNDDDTDMMDDGPTLEERQTSQQAAITTAAAGVTTALTGLNSTSPTQGQVDALDAAIAALDAAIKAAEDLSDSAKSAASGTLTFAQSAVAKAKADIAAAAKVGRVATQKGAIATASNRVTTARNALSSPVPTQAEVKELNDAITALQAAIDGADDVAADDAALVGANTDIGSARTAASTAQGQIDTARGTQAAAIQKEASRLNAAREDLEDAGDEPTADLVARLRAAIDRLQGAVDAATTDSAGRWSADEDAIKTATAAIREANAEHTVADASVKGAENTAKAEEVKRHEDAITAATGRVKSARSALSDPPTPDQITDLDNAIKGLETAISEAQSVSTELAAVLSTAGELVGSAKNVLMTAKKDREAADIAERKEDNEAPMKVAEAINAHKLSTEADVTVPGEFSGRTVSRTSGDAVIKLNQTTQQAKDKPYTMSDAPSAGSGWMGKTFVHTNDKARRPFTERGTIYTDIEKAGDALWTAVNFTSHSDNTGLNLAGNNTKNVEFTVGSARLRTGDITGEKVVPGKPGTENGTAGITIKIGDSERGTLFGQPGNFSCANSDCVITRTGDQLAFTGGALTFDPDSGDPKVKYGDPDGDFTHFGYWMKSTTQRDGTIEHDIRTFAGGEGYVTQPQGTTDGSAGNLHKVRGTANYYGVAAGVYVKKDGAGDALEVTNGEFTADATLKASFGGPDIAANDHFSISGTISGFADGSTNLGFGPLTLEKAKFGSGANSGSVTPDSSGVATGDSVGWAFAGGSTDGGGVTGEWSGQFFGDVGGDTNASGNDEHQYDDYPANVSGEFNGHFTNGHVAGAFGAEYDE